MSENLSMWELVLKKWDKTSTVELTNLFDENVLCLDAMKSNVDLDNFLAQCDVDVLNGRLQAWPIVYFGIVHRQHLRLLG
jgi:hypothetical protein